MATSNECCDQPHRQTHLPLALPTSAPLVRPIDLKADPERFLIVDLSRQDAGGKLSGKGFAFSRLREDTQHLRREIGRGKGRVAPPVNRPYLRSEDSRNR